MQYKKIMNKFAYILIFAIDVLNNDNDVFKTTLVWLIFYIIFVDMLLTLGNSRVII